MQRSFPLGLSLVLAAAVVLVGSFYFLSVGISHRDQSTFVLKTLSERSPSHVASVATYRDGGDGGSGGDGGGDGGSADGIVVTPPAPLPPACVLSNSNGALVWTSTNATSASFNQGIGFVGVNGMLSVYPSVTTQYILTVSGAGGSATCATTVVVVPPPAKPYCTISNNGYSLTWTSTNATSASLNQGIGAVAVNGSKSVAPAVTTTYTLTVNGDGGSATCSTTVTKTPPPAAPVCTLTVTPSTIHEGEQSTLAWTSTNAVTATLSGEAGNVALNGSFPVSPVYSTDYAITVKNSAGVSKICTTAITVIPKTVTPKPACSITNNGSSLSWTSTNATSASIDNGVGSVAVNGSVGVSPHVTTTYTLTVNGAGGTAQCSTTCVRDVPPPTTQGPSCTLTVSPSTIQEGGETILAWTATNAVTATLSGGGGNVAMSGSFPVHPAYSMDYGITVVNAAGVSAYCQTHITVVPPTDPVYPTDKPVMHCYLPVGMQPASESEKTMLHDSLVQSLHNYVSYMNSHGYSWDPLSEVSIEND